MKKLLSLLCKTIHAFQKERGSLCLHLSTKDEYSRLCLNDCIKNSNHLTKELISYNNGSKSLLNTEQCKSYEKINNIIMGFHKLAPFRNDIDIGTIDIFEVTPLYTHRVIIHLGYILVELILFDTNNNPAEVSAFSNFINWKERIGRERALGIVGFALNEFDSEQFSSDFSLLISEQKINKRSFLSLASDSQKKVFKNDYKKYDDIEKIHRQMEADQIPQIDAKNWFRVVSDKMEMMHLIELNLIQNFYQDHQISKNKDKKAKIDQAYSLALDFPIFRNLPKATTKQLFQSSNIQQYKKGSLLFLEGEQASRIYVVLNGWIKIFRSSAEGHESVEQMLTTGSLVVESSIFENDKYYSSAQVNNDAKLLSFPASIFRHLITNDSTLALNVLKYLSLHNRDQINQIDNNRLKSSKERVGWFLLKQFIEQQNPNTILLPYDKTIIASLLDMKPETFSRSLKLFKTKGLKSEKHQIQVDDIELLCGYCDSNLQTHCQFKKNHDCKYNK